MGTDAGTEVEGHACGSGDLRKLIMPVNPRNLFMPPRRRRNGRGREAVVRQRPSASCQGGPGIVKDRPHLRGHGREH